MKRTPKSEKNSHLRVGAAAAQSDPPCFVERRGANLLLRLTVQPRATPEGPAGIHTNRLRLRVGAAPVDDAANARVVSLLSELLDLPRAAIRILRGEHSRNKDVLLHDGGAALERIALMAGNSAHSGRATGTGAAHAHSARTRKP